MDPTSPTPSAEEALGSSAERLRDSALTVLRRFGLVAVVWSGLLAATAPAVDHPGRMGVGLTAMAAWALASLRVTSPQWWWAGWLVCATFAELLGPWAGTIGWSVAGGSSLVVLGGAALTGRARPVVAAVGWLSAVAVVRGVVGDGWSVGDAVGTGLLLGFGGLALAWLVAVAQRALRERDELAVRVARAEATAARQHERAEAAARLHDTVLQHLTTVARAADLDEARRGAGRAGNELRSFLRLDAAAHATLRAALEAEVTLAADGHPLSVGLSGDRPTRDGDHLLVAAAAEAVRNAARHGGPGRIRVFGEVADDGVCTVWVTDQGPGFDRAAVEPGRLGIIESIEGRMARAGGAATVRSDGDGTEWTLTLPPPP